MEAYKSRGPVDCDVDLDTSALRGKSVIVTGGANGMGEAHVRAFCEAGAIVTFGDLDVAGGKKLESELGGKATFVECNVAQWGQQVALFKQCLSTSISNTIDVVVANAGIAGADSVYMNSEAANLDEPEEPNLRLLNVNLSGTMYTIKLALHYFNRQHSLEKDHSADRSLILIGSISGYLDQPGSPQYNAAKFGIRGAMRSLRRTSWKQGVRINQIAPWFMKTKMQSEELVKQTEARGVEYALVPDAAAAVAKLASDCGINGRTLAIVPRKWAPRGYMDLDVDDFAEDSEYRAWQDILLKASHRA